MSALLPASLLWYHYRKTSYGRLLRWGVRWRTRTDTTLTTSSSITTTRGRTQNFYKRFIEYKTRLSGFPSHGSTARRSKDVFIYFLIMEKVLSCGLHLYDIAHQFFYHMERWEYSTLNLAKEDALERWRSCSGASRSSTIVQQGN